MPAGSPRRFVDTNILLYAYDLESPKKRIRAKRIIEEGWQMLGQMAISVQVLQELEVNLERKKVSRGEIHQLIYDLSVWPVVDNTLMILKMALSEQVRWQLSLWDAMILAAARSVGASELVTEDFSHGQNYDGVRAVNPFR